jgi:serine/threonine-protein kinase
VADSFDRLKTALANRYAIERELGAGGMATVYLAEDLKHHRKVAVKVLRPELAAVLGAERFLKEIEVTANLQHPHILPLFDSGEADSFLYYVMPFIDGETLRDKLNRETQLGIDEAVRITTDVADALDYAHQQGVIHRDMKPENILLHNGRPMVADFGIALAVSAAAGGRMTETGLSLGTPHYMSPEQATADKDLTNRSDIYSLGAVLYEMLAGAPPHLGGSAQQIIMKIVTDTPRPVTELRKSVPPNVTAAVAKALEKLAADRFASAASFAEALSDPGFRHGGEAAVGVAAGRGLWHPLQIATTGVALLFGVGFAWALLRPEPPQPVSRLELNLPEGLELTGEGVDLAVSPDGLSVVFVGSSPGRGTRLWRRPLDQLTAVPIPGTENGRNPCFSPDGTSIAFAGNGGLRTVSLTGAPPLTIVSSGVPDFSVLAWGADGMIYFTTSGPVLWRVPESGGEQEEVTTPGEGRYVLPEALPNGRAILLTRDLGGPTEDEIAVLSLETGEIRTLLQGAMARYAHSGHIVYVSGEGTLLAAPFDLDRLEVTGSSRALLEGVRVNSFSSSQFALSETGVLVYRTGAALETGVPVWVDRDGSEELLDPTLTGGFGAPAISPDGSKVAFEHGSPGSTMDIWIYDLDQRTFSRLTFEGTNLRPFWSPDGSEVGFSSAREGPSALYARPADLSGEARLLVAGEVGLIDAVWTPDGRWLVYERGSIDLAYAAPDPDSTPVVLLDTPFTEDQPSLSPDGRWLAYQSNESGRTEVYVRPFPGPGGQTPVSAGGAQNPVWAPNGREIFYLAADNFWFVATVQTDPEFAVQSRDRFASAEGFETELGTPHFDVSPGDQRLLAIRTGPSSGAGGRTVVVLNFFEELKAKVGN